MKQRKAVNFMDLRNGKITVREITSNPKAMEIFEREFGELAHHPMVKMASSMPLTKVIKLAKKHLERDHIERLISELEQI